MGSRQTYRSKPLGKSSLTTVDASLVTVNVVTCGFLFKKCVVEAVVEVRAHMTGDHS